MKILKKIIKTIVPVSKQDMAEIQSDILKMTNAIDELKRDMIEMTNVLNGFKIVNGQQATMISNIVNQVSGMQMKKAEKQVEEEKKVGYDEAFQ